MRGKAIPHFFRYFQRRITPAYAGKSQSFAGHSRRSQDHPRLCGEKYNDVRVKAFQAGSPPPMRGKVLRYRKWKPCKGITPAYAGKRFRRKLTRQQKKDHPRLCGEKFIMAMEKNKVKGSPPPMRGKVARYFSARSVGRITPAYAGKSIKKQRCRKPQTDHPRLCGEKTTGILKPPTSIGSPPPMRGKVFVGG